MNFRPTIQERAYQLTAMFKTIADMRRQLIREGYENVDAHLAVRTLRITLKRMCRAAAKARLAAATRAEVGGLDNRIDGVAPASPPNASDESVDQAR